MRKSIEGLIVAFVLIIITFIFQNSFKFENKIYRYEQHTSSCVIQDYGNAFDKSLISHLPIISIETNGQKIPGFAIIGNEQVYEKGDNGEEKIVVDIKIYDNEKAQNSLSDEATLLNKALFNIRGNSSRYFTKSSYKIEFVDNQMNSTELPVMGMNDGKEWVLYAPYLDKTLQRNYMWMNISGKIMGYAPNVRFCECYIDGDYKGLYVMMESIEQGKNRVDISSFSSNDRVFSYILKMDKLMEDVRNLVTFSSYSSHLDDRAGFTILYPKTKDLTPEVKKFIENDISKFEKVLYSYDFDNKKEGYAKYIDINSWVDFYIIQEFLANNDMCSKSTYLYKDKGGKIKIGPVWDFNNVCDNYLDDEFGTEGFLFAETKVWYKMLLKDENFVKKVQKRYKELRKTFLSEEYLMNYIDEVTTYLGNAIERNYEVWGYTFKRENQSNKSEFLQPIERNPENYEEAINQYKTFLKERGKWLDENIDSLSQYSHYSKNKLYAK